MNESQLSHAESLQLITEMIAKAKRNIAKRGSFYFLLWGWVVMIGNLGHYVIAKYDLFPAPYVIWILTIPAAIISVWYSIKQKNLATSTSQIDKVYGHLWMAVFVAIVTLLVFMSELGFKHNAVILLFAGVGTFVSGRVLRFDPLVFGGIALWIGSVIAFKVSILDSYLVGGIGIILGYLIPGYMLRNAEGKN